MLVHHDHRAYDVAAKEASAVARNKFEEIISRGEENRNSLIRKLYNDTPQDVLVDTAAMQFGCDEIRGLNVAFAGGSGLGIMPIERNAVGQLANFTGGMLGTKNINAFIDKGRWGQELLTGVLGEAMQKLPRDRMLLRAVPADLRRLDGMEPESWNVRSCLSDKYRPIESGEILRAVFDHADELGAVPVSTQYDGLRWRMQVYLPMIFEPVPNEVMMMGMNVRSSDHGCGALDISFVSMRLWCTNQMIAERLLHQVHLGEKLDRGIDWSAKTQTKASELLYSQIGDVARAALSPERCNAECDRVRQAHEAKLTGQEAKDLVTGYFKRGRITKGTRDTVIDAYNTPDVEMLPAGNSMYRLSQTFGLVAQRKTTGEGKSERPVGLGERERLEAISGELMQIVAPAPKVKIRGRR